MFKRCLSIFLAGVLAFSSAVSPYCAYAEAVYTESLGFSDVLTEVDPSVNGEGSTGEASGAFALDESAAAEGQDIESDESAENLISSESADGGSSAVLPEDIIDYIYIDQSVLALGDVQYIAVAFKKPINQCILPELELSDSSGGVHKVAASAVNDGAALFEVAYNDQSCTLSYEGQESPVSPPVHLRESISTSQVFRKPIRPIASTLLILKPQGLLARVMKAGFLR